MSKSDKWIDDLYQRMHGFKTVERSDVQHGQSEWYYIDPRYDDECWQIDVANESSKNPRLNGILADDMDKNPENYYIWRTQGDEKVRGAHAAREGLIFNKHIPPKGGNPGEDYNCRCWAEPYEPEKYRNKQMIVDLGGLDMFKELTKELRPVDLNIKSLPQYATNDIVNKTSDVVYSNNEENKPYTFSTKMKNLLGGKESKNDYKSYNLSGGGIGALGKYQIRKDGLIDTGYLTKDNKWTGKNGIKSIEDFLNNPKAQEIIFDEYMKVQYKYLLHFGETKYVGAKFKGIVSDFKITNIGLLAATHRTGIDYMNKFFKHLEKDENGIYYIDYDKIQDSDLKTKFLWIETRLREFED